MYKNMLAEKYQNRRNPYLEPFSSMDQMSKYLKKGKLLLGFEHDSHSKVWKYDIDKPVYIKMPKYSPSPPAIVIIGARGGSKTSTVMNMVWQAHMQGLPVFGIDPKCTMAKYTKPQSKYEYKETLSKLGIDPLGLDIYTITPEFLKGAKRYRKTNKFYSLSKKDFDNILDYSFRRLLFYHFIDVDSRSEDSGAMRIMAVWKYARTFNELRPIAEQMTESKAKLVFEKLKVLVGDSVLEGDSLESFDIGNIINEHILLMQCSLARGESRSSGHVSVMIQKLRELAEKGHFKGKTVFFVGEEIDVLLRKGTPSAEQLNFIYSKDRENGIAPCFVLQNPKDAQISSFTQSDYLITPALRRGTPEFDLLKQFTTNSNAERAIRLKSFGLIKEQMLVEDYEDATAYIPLISPCNA